MKKVVAILLVIALTLFSFAGCGGSGGNSAESDEPIKIGTIFPQSGDLALLGSQAMYGAEIARQLINENGGVNGKQVEFVSADAPGATEATSEANRLIDQEKVNIIIGSLSSGNALAIRSVTEKAGAILWETSGISDAVTADSSNVFRTCDRGGLRGYYGMKFIAETIAPQLGIEAKNVRIALVNEDSSYGESLVLGAQQAVEELGLNVVAHERYNKDITDFSALVQKVKDTKPDVIFAISYVNDAALLYDTLKQFKAVPKVLLGGGAGFTDPNFFKVFQEASNGVFCIDMPTNLEPSVFSDQAVKDLQAEFHKRYAEMDTKSPTPPLAAECVFMGTYTLLHDVLPNAASMATEDVAAAAKAVNIAETTMGWSVQFDESGQNVGANPVIGQWQDGKTMTVWPDKFAKSTIKYIPMQ